MELSRARFAKFSPDQLSKYAEQFAKILHAFDPQVQVRRNPGRDIFVNVYHEDLPQGAGAYFFHTRADVFYIGKANDFSRIWAHTKAAKLSPEGKMAFANAPLATRKRLTAELREAVLSGNFQIDYIAIAPGALADGLEVFLQSVYRAATGRLPYGNEQIG